MVVAMVITINSVIGRFFSETVLSVQVQVPDYIKTFRFQLYRIISEKKNNKAANVLITFEEVARVVIIMRMFLPLAREYTHPWY